MYEEYVREKAIIEKTEEQQDLELMQSVITTKLELEAANRNFEFAEEELIDYYTYQIKANQAKLNYLLKKIKRKGIILDRLDELGLRLYGEDEVG